MCFFFSGWSRQMFWGSISCIETNHRLESQLDRPTVLRNVPKTVAYIHTVVFCSRSIVLEWDSTTICSTAFNTLHFASVGLIHCAEVLVLSLCPVWSCLSLSTTLAHTNLWPCTFCTSVSRISSKEKHDSASILACQYRYEVEKPLLGGLAVWTFLFHCILPPTNTLSPVRLATAVPFFLSPQTQSIGESCIKPNSSSHVSQNVSNATVETVWEEEEKRRNEQPWSKPIVSSYTQVLKSVENTLW